MPLLGVCPDHGRHNTQLDLGMVHLAGVHGQLVGAILQEAGGVSCLDGLDFADHIGRSSVGGLVVDGIANGDILQLLERGGILAVAVMSGDGHVAEPAGGAVKVGQSLLHVGLRGAS